MRVLHVGAELYPFVKTGGLGDVTAALPPALRTAGIDARLLLPGFPGFLQALPSEPVARLAPSFGAAEIVVRRAVLPGGDVPAYLLDAPLLFDRPGNPYLGPDGRDWPDNHRRFGLLGRAAAWFAEGLVEGWRPEIVHGHDWHAGMAPAYLAARGGLRARSVFTIHNLAFQGLFPAETFDAFGLPARMFAVEGVEFHGRVSFMKAAIHYADRITTVSPTYAREIRTVAHGCGLDGLLRSRAVDLVGILNGVDYAAWDPANDPLIAAPFSAGRPDGKAACKAALQKAAGFELAPERPLFGVVSRLTGQKGMDLLAEALPTLLASGGQLVLLGSGEPALEAAFRVAASGAPACVHARIGYDEAFAHAIYAGSDFVLVPSRFEPCGLTQMYAMRYGALPVARRTGGLADSIVDAAGEALAAGRATGILFDDASGAALGSAIRRAAALHAVPDRLRQVRHTAMRQRFGWDVAAAAYIEVYRSACA